MKKFIVLILGLLLISVITYDLKSPPILDQNLYDLEYQVPVVETEHAVIRGIAPVIIKSLIYEYQVSNHQHEVLPMELPGYVILYNRKKAPFKNLNLFDDLSYGNYIRSNNRGNLILAKARHRSATLRMMNGLSLLSSNRQDHDAINMV